MPPKNSEKTVWGIPEQLYGAIDAVELHKLALNR